MSLVPAVIRLSKKFERPLLFGLCIVGPWSFVFGLLSFFVGW